MAQRCRVTDARTSVETTYAPKFDGEFVPNVDNRGTLKVCEVPRPGQNEEVWVHAMWSAGTWKVCRVTGDRT